MQGFVVAVGLLAALALLSLGLLVLPGPTLGSVPGLFSALWLLVTFFAAAAFAREAWRRDRLHRARKRLRGLSTRRRRAPRSGRAPGEAWPEEFIRQRERRSG